MLILPRMEPSFREFTTPLDNARVSYLLSEEIASCVMELIQLEHQERDYAAMLERKAELEQRIAYLQRMESKL